MYLLVGVTDLKQLPLRKTSADPYYVKRLWRCSRLIWTVASCPLNHRWMHHMLSFHLSLTSSFIRKHTARHNKGELKSLKCNARIRSWSEWQTIIIYIFKNLPQTWILSYWVNLKDKSMIVKTFHILTNIKYNLIQYIDWSLCVVTKKNAAILKDAWKIISIFMDRVKLQTLTTRLMVICMGAGGQAHEEE